MAEPFSTVTTIFPRSNWKCLSLSIVLHYAMCEIMKLSLLLKTNVFVYEGKVFMEGTSHELNARQKGFELNEKRGGR